MMTGHDRYFYANANHEAAYDSLVTAKVFIRMSAFLEAEGDYVNMPDDTRHILMNNPDALAKSLMARKSQEASARQVVKGPQPLLQHPTEVHGKMSWFSLYLEFNF